MMKKYTFSFLFTICLFSLMAQHTITGQILPKGEHNLMLLYKTEGAFQYYKASTTVDEDGLFGFSLPKDFPTGSYRLVYDAQKNEYVNIIYNNENISFSFDPHDLINSIYFYDSKENSALYEYIAQINEKYQELDSIQKLNYEDYGNIKLFKAYQAKRAELNEFQSYFENKADSLIAKKFIQAYKKTNSEKPLKSKDDYYQFLKKTYLNSIDFKDEDLRNSSFILDRMIEYVFDLNVAIAKRNNSDIDLSMVDFALNKMDDSKFKNEVIYSLTSSAFDPYTSQYDLLLNHLYLQYYKKLPTDQQNKEFTDMVISKLNVIKGKKAPNFAIADSSLHQIKAKQSLLVFWSTTCSHCREEIPEVYQLLSDKEDVAVVLIGLEEIYSDWETVITDFPKWAHIRANGKWDHEIAKAYNIKSTPVYFILDDKKTIIDKPNKLVDLKAWFSK